MSDDKKGKCLHVPGSMLDKANDALFDVEEMFPLGHPVRSTLFEARCLVGRAQQYNKQDKDRPQETFVVKGDGQCCRDCSTTKNVTVAPDPYQQDINGDETLVMLCSKCRQRLVDDI